MFHVQIAVKVHSPVRAAPACPAWRRRLGKECRLSPLPSPTQEKKVGLISIQFNLIGPSKRELISSHTVNPVEDDLILL